MIIFSGKLENPFLSAFAEGIRQIRVLKTYRYASVDKRNADLADASKRGRKRILNDDNPDKSASYPSCKVFIFCKIKKS